MYITPCVSICKIIEGVCSGCGRTREQIANWRRYTDEERLDIMKRLGYGVRKKRKKDEKSSF